MNVTHLARLVNSLDNCWFKKKKSKRKKKGPGRCGGVTFGSVLHLNLNLWQVLGNDESIIPFNETESLRTKVYITIHVALSVYEHMRLSEYIVYMLLYIFD